MESSGYATLTRQSGLAREMRVVANNIANVSTDGFRREGVVFSEFVRRLGDGEDSLSMAAARARETDFSDGPLRVTGGEFDVAIEGQGFFAVATPDGNQLTRAGAFTLAPDGALVTSRGDRVLDDGQAPIQVPQGAGAIEIGADGTLSRDGQPFARLGVWEAVDPLTLSRAEGTKFTAGEIEPVEGARVRQGAIEGSNVDPTLEIARMVEVQRAYELGQAFLDREDERIRSMIRTMGQ